MPSRHSDPSSPAPRHPGRPWQNSYAAIMPSAVMSLVPFIVTTTAWDLFSKALGQSIGAKAAPLERVLSLSTATCAITAASTAFCIFLYLSGSVSLPRPDLESWLGQRGPALHSPRLFAAFRRR
jgi:hypothetical protein